MVFTIAEASAYLKVTEKTLLRWTEQGVMPFKRQNGEVIFQKNELMNWAYAKKIGVPIEQAQVGAQPTEEAELSLVDAVKKGGVYYDIAGESKTYILEHIADYFALPNEVIASQLSEQLLMREKLASTGIGHGIVIPHPRYPNDWGLHGSTIGVFYTKNEIDFNAHDGEHVYVLFVLLSSTIKSHLKILSKLSHYLHLPENRDFIFTKPGLKELLGHMEQRNV